MSASIPAVILGATGYVGGELLRLIHAHPNFEFAAAISESASGQPVASTFPHLAAAYDGVKFESYDSWPGLVADGSRLAVFSAAAHHASAALIDRVIRAAETKSLDVHVVDSSSAFRYTKETDWASVYGDQHGAPELLADFVCAVPEHLDAAPKRHVGHPGCFATAILLAAVPAVDAGLVDGELFVSAITGSTGSGKSPQAGTHHPQRHSNLYAYKPLEHRHTPEIVDLCKAATGRDIEVNFVPHSGPFARGIHATVQAKCTKPISGRELRTVYDSAYADAVFVEVVDGTPKLKDVVASNHCQIGVAVNGDSLVVMSVIDNLVKGAAGGAVQWMNRLWDLPETAGLTAPAPAWT